jgi:hypothetical protein
LQLTHVQGAPRLLVATQQCVEPRQHFGKCIGLGQLIVATSLQALDLVLGR